MMEINLKQRVKMVVVHVSQEAKSRAFRAANELRNSSLVILRGQRTGRVYRIPFSSRSYTASAPGEPPAVRTGKLRRSWRTVIASEQSNTSMTVRPAIITDTKYAPDLDKGTKRMKSRPFEEPIINHAKPKIKRIYTEPYFKK